MPNVHPREALFDPEDRVLPEIPVCDHYAGVESRMRRSLQLQAEMGPVFDVTLDNEDGAPLGGEIEQAHLIRELLDSPDNRHGRVGVRLLPVAHPLFADVAGIVLRASKAPAYLMCPKPRGLQELQRAARVLDALGAAGVPLHALIETHGALREVFDMAAHPRIESLSFGLMDFVSAHRGAIRASAMAGPGQFDHPLVVRAKLDIAAACHAEGKTPSHCVFTEFKDTTALRAAAEMAAGLLGYTRMWSIHPAQIQPIVDAFAPAAAEVAEAAEILDKAQAANWAPIQHRHQLQDRASYRHGWQLLTRASRTGTLPADMRARWF